MRGAERLPGVERIWLPGEQSHLKRQDRVTNGIPMPKPLRDSLDAVARDLGIVPLANIRAQPQSRRHVRDVRTH